MFANNEDPDQMPHYVASDLGLHCLLMTLLKVSRLEWVKNSSRNRRVANISVSKRRWS